MIKMLPMRQTISSLLLLTAFTGCGLFTPLEKRLVSSDDQVRSKALKKLARLDPEDRSLLIKPLVVDLQDPESRLANRAADALVVIGQPVVEEVRQTLKNPDVFVRLSAASILERLGPDGRGAIADLIICLKDTHPLVREEAARALGQMGQTAEAAGPALITALKDTNKEVKEASSEALKKIGITPPRIS